MTGHYIEKCVHGTVGGQCRCPSPSKTVKHIDCPPDCPQRVRTDIVVDKERLYATTDVTVWAEEFMKVVESGAKVDKSLMITWFANAMETERNHHIRQTG